MKAGDVVVIDDPALPTNGSKIYVLAVAGRWLMVSWTESPWGPVIPFVLSISQVAVEKERRTE